MDCVSDSQLTVTLMVSSMALPRMLVFSARHVTALWWSLARGRKYTRDTVSDSPLAVREN